MGRRACRRRISSWTCETPFSDGAVADKRASNIKRKSSPEEDPPSSGWQISWLFKEGGHEKSSPRGTTCARRGTALAPRIACWSTSRSRRWPKPATVPLHGRQAGLTRATLQVSGAHLALRFAIGACHPAYSDFASARLQSSHLPPASNHTMDASVPPATQIGLPEPRASLADARHAAPDSVLVSHALCPYVQRAAIVLAERAWRSSAGTSTRGQAGLVQEHLAIEQDTGAAGGRRGDLRVCRHLRVPRRDGTAPPAPDERSAAGATSIVDGVRLGAAEFDRGVLQRH